MKVISESPDLFCNTVVMLVVQSVIVSVLDLGLGLSQVVSRCRHIVVG